MIFLNVNQILSLSCLSFAFAFGKKSKPFTKSLHDLVLCTSPTSSRTLCSSPFSPSRTSSTFMFLDHWEFSYLGVNSPSVSSAWSASPTPTPRPSAYSMGGASTSMSLLRYNAFPVHSVSPSPFWKKSLLRFFLVPTVICNYLVYLFIFLFIIISIMQTNKNICY